MTRCVVMHRIVSSVIALFKMLENVFKSVYGVQIVVSVSARQMNSRTICSFQL